MAVRYRGIDMLFAADIGDKYDKFINTPCEILKVSHHGSKYATTDAFLDSARPQAAIISVGSNSFGHPTEETLSRLSEHGAEIYRTDYMGAITIDVYTDGEYSIMGSGVLSRLKLNIGAINKLNAVVLSHLHFDHMSDMGVLGYMLDFSGLNSMKLICPGTPASALSLVSSKFDRYLPCDMRIGEFEVSFMRVKHPVETYALKVFCDGTCFVYTGDTNICPEISIFADGADLLLADACFLHKEWSASKPHMSARLCGKLATEAKAGELVLTHFRPDSDTEELLDEAR